MNSSKMHNMSVNEPWFSYIKNGTKKYEGRCYRGKTLLVQKGDLIAFQRHPLQDNDNETVLKTVAKVHVFPTFEDALKALPIGEMLPGVTDVATGVLVYYKYVSRETQLAHGVCMIELQ